MKIASFKPDQFTAFPRGVLLLALLSGLALGRAAETAVAPPAATQRPASPPAQIDFPKLSESFRCEAYLEVAAVLQTLPEAQRVTQLRAWAAELDSHYPPGRYRPATIAILCRMLFEPKRGQSFRGEGLGAPYFVGYTRFSPAEVALKFPLEPILLVDGIPFDVVRGTSMAGSGSEGASDYENFRQGSWSVAGCWRPSQMRTTSTQRADSLTW